MSQGQLTLFHYMKELMRLAVMAGVEEAINDPIFPNPAETQTAKDVKARISRSASRQLALPGTEPAAAEPAKNGEAQNAADARRGAGKPRKDESPAKENGQ